MDPVIGVILGLGSSIFLCVGGGEQVFGPYLWYMEVPRPGVELEL